MRLRIGSWRVSDGLGPLHDTRATARWTQRRPPQARTRAVVRLPRERLLRYYYAMPSSYNRINARLRMFGGGLAVAALAVGAMTSLSVLAQTAPAQRIDAVIVTLDGTALQLRPRAGGDPVAVTFDDATR